MSTGYSRLTILAGAGVLALAIAALLAGRSATPGANAAADASATIEVMAPAAPQPLNTAFTVTDNLTSFVAGVTQPAWAGWDLRLAYDPTIVVVDGAVSGGLCLAYDWANPNRQPNVQTSCIAQASTATGVMDTITFHCIADGTSPLTLLAGNPPAGTDMFDRQGISINMTLVSSSVTCLAGATVTPTSTPTPTNTPTDAQATQTAAASATTPVPTATGHGAATIAVIAPPDPQSLNLPFIVTDNLISFVPGTSTTWAGWSLALDYDKNIVSVDGAVAGVLCPPYVWGNPPTPSDFETGCAFQSSSSTGVMDVITMRCVAVGTSPLTLRPAVDALGTSLFDHNAFPFLTTLVNTSVTCTDATPTPTFTATATATSTATPTATVEDVAMVKSDDPNNAPLNSGQLINLWLCKGPNCTNNGDGALDVYEWALNVGGDPDGVGAFEFQVKYDNHIFNISIDPTNWLWPTGRVPDVAGGVAGGCAATIVTENDIRFGCVSKDDPNIPGIGVGPKDSGVIATIHVSPKADLVNRITPGNDNGAIRSLLDEGCEFADIWGHPLSTNQLDALGREILLPGVLPGGQIADCGDVTITVRILEGDMNLDCQVTAADDQIEASHYGAFFGSLLYQPWYDLEPAIKDGDVDIKDVQKVLGRNGSTCSNPVPAQPPLPEPVAP